MKFLHVMDPIERIDITKDTSYVFIREAQLRGHENYYCGIADLAFDHGRVAVRSATLKVGDVQGSHAELLARGGLYARLWAHQSGGFLGETTSDDTPLTEQA